MLPELDALRKCGIFTTEETRAILKKRKRYEYKMQRRTKEKDVYLQYIQYEISVLDLIKLRREKRKIDGKKEDIERTIVARIHKLFRIACFRFKSDVKLWLTYIDFAKRRMDKNRVSKIITTMLQIHNKRPNLWIMAAKFEFEVNETPEIARQLFQRAIRFLPNSQKLWLEYFKMELLCIELILKRKQMLGIEGEMKDDQNNQQKTNQDAILSCKVAQVVVKSGLKQLPNEPYFLQSFVMIAKDFEFAKDLVEFIYNCLTNNASLANTEETWDIIARKHLNEEANILKKCEETGQIADFTLAELEQQTNNVFLEALEKLKTQKMWLIYIKFCTERLNLNSQFLNEERLARLTEAYEKASSSFELSLESTVQRIETLSRFGKLDEAVNVLDKALDKFKGSVELWKYKVKLWMDFEKSPDEIFSLFNMTLNEIKEKESYQIWDLMLKWCIQNNSKETENLLKKASLLSREVSLPSRIMYLDWCFQNSGKNKVNQVYESLHKLPPYDVAFYIKYIELQKCFDHVDSSAVGRTFEEALKHFGDEDMELWLNYFEFSNQNHKGDPQNVYELYWKAMKQLNEGLKDDFSQKFNIFKLKLDGNSQIDEDDSD